MSETDAGREILRALQERAKELNCLYQVEELLTDQGLTPEEAFRGIVEAIPAGWQHPALCQVRLRVGEQVFASDGFEETPWTMSAEHVEDGVSIDRLEVCYREAVCGAGEAPFLPDEARLVGAIAERVGHYVQHQRLKRAFAELDRGRSAGGPGAADEWRGAVHLLRATDPELHVRLARRMLRHLRWAGVKEADDALEAAADDPRSPGLGVDLGSAPTGAERPNDGGSATDEPFELAARHMTGREILELVRRWVMEEKPTLLARVLEDRQSTLLDVSAALRRFRHRSQQDSQTPESTTNGLKVSLIRRFLSDELGFMTRIKPHLEIEDFLELAERMIYPAGSHGKIGGKSAGVFAATRILERSDVAKAGGFAVKYPRSWYVASDGLSDFVEHNDLHEWVVEQKYKDPDQVRQEYPLLVRLFKKAAFSPEMVRGLSMALDDFQNRPLIVRSSSLGEDRAGTPFSGKYKSLFLANQGSKSDRLAALLDAIAEVYASAFGPEPIEYRRERGLLDFHEEMGILLQEVVGVRTGQYYLPAFAGVAFSNNEFRWSPRIERTDGLVRLVPGLGTRAVDRVGDDYPVLVAPGKPALRASVSNDERIRYSPRMIDVIDLRANTFATMEIGALLREPGVSYPAMEKVFSILQHGSLARVSPLLVHPARDRLVVTFDGLLQDTAFMTQMNTMLQVLQDRLGTPVDLEFASDGRDLYLLQCRAQSQSDDLAPAAIPRDVADDDVVFRARRYVSSGSVPDITHIVYVDPQAYAELRELSDLRAVARAVGRLNQALPKRRFILMGPGRWGSRGDAKLGVGVAYSEINNTAVLIEIARQKGGYVPDLSFGTHFFQDLVESSIRYLPLFPDDADGVLNEAFLRGAPNVLAALAPEFDRLSPVVRVVDVREAGAGRVLRVYMNGDENEALGVLTLPEG